VNCHNPTKGRYNYQGVVLCSSCFSLANMCDKRAVKQCKDLLMVYREALRVQLASGQLQPSTKLPRKREKIGPPTRKDLVSLLKKLVESAEVDS
jgi:hypothetical protein